MQQEKEKEKDNNISLFKTEPSKFLISMKKNGMIYSNDINKLQDFLDNTSNYIDKLTNDIISLFKSIQNYGINYIYYVVLFKELSIQKIKNLYRFFLIKWNLLKTKSTYKLKDIEITYNMDSIVNIYTEPEQLKQAIVTFFNTFVNNGEFYFLFFMNTFHEYLSPITK